MSNERQMGWMKIHCDSAHMSESAVAGIAAELKSLCETTIAHHISGVQANRSGNPGGLRNAVFMPMLMRKETHICKGGSRFISGSFEFFLRLTHSVEISTKSRHPPKITLRKIGRRH
jgi:hypothetical protein